MVSVRRGFLFLLVLRIGCVILLQRSLDLQYNYFDIFLMLDDNISICYLKVLFYSRKKNITAISVRCIYNKELGCCKLRQKTESMESRPTFDLIDCRKHGV